MTETPTKKLYIAFLVCDGEIIDCDWNESRSSAMESFEGDQHFYTAPSNDVHLVEGYFCEMRVDCNWENDEIGDYLNDLDPRDLRKYTLFSWDNRYTLGV